MLTKLVTNTGRIAKRDSSSTDAYIATKKLAPKTRKLRQIRCPTKDDGGGVEVFIGGHWPLLFKKLYFVHVEN